MRLAKVFNDGLIINQFTSFSVWGFDAKEMIEIRLVQDGKIMRQKCEKCCGDFCVEIEPVAGSYHTYQLIASDAEQEIVVNNVVFGAVFLALGQSNMSYPLSAVERRDELFETMKSRDVRFLDIKESCDDGKRPVLPQEDLSDNYEWTVSPQEEMFDCSAISCIFSMLLSEKIDMPIGIVIAAMGGLSIESYLPYQVVDADSMLKEKLIGINRYVDKEKYNTCGERNYTQIAGVFNEKINPIINFSFTGILWYLGESAAYDYLYAQIYAQELSMLIDYYRKLFDEIPFIAVEIAPEYYGYGDDYGYLYINEAIQDVCRSKKDCFNIPTYDITPHWLICDTELYYHPIHPTNKFPIASRMCDVVFNNVFQNKKFFFPFIKSVSFSADGAECVIENCSQKLIENDRINGFTLAGCDGKYYHANGRCISKDRIKVQSENVQNPCRLTYQFKQYQSDCNLFSDSCQPIMSYRSEREPVSEKYFFRPAFANCLTNTVSENCFGYSVGISHDLAVWKSGEIYKNDNVEITSQLDGIHISAKPRNCHYYFFGVSPEICLSGHKNHLKDYNFMSIELSCSNTDIEFYGCVIRLTDGKVFRLILRNGTENIDTAILQVNRMRFFTSLAHAYDCQMSQIRLSDCQRTMICSMELLFRSKNNCEVTIHDIDFLNDENLLIGAAKAERVCAEENSAMKIMKNK